MTYFVMSGVGGYDLFNRMFLLIGLWVEKDTEPLVWYLYPISNMMGHIEP